MKQYFLVLVGVSVVLEIAADIFFKYWSISNKNWLLWIGMGIYVVGTLIWAYSLKFELLSRAIVVFTLLNLIVIALVGVFVFKEDLSLANKIGILLGAISVVLVQL